MTTKEREEDFKSKIKEHELLVWKVCRVYTRTQQDREDLFQEIMIQLWRAFPTYNGLAKLTKWMYRVALYTAISGLRKKKITIEDREIDSVSNLTASDEYKIKEEQLADLYKAIEQLNDIDKAIVTLYLEDKNYEEMEEILGINQGNLRVKMNRIKEKLRKLTNN